MKRVIQGRKDKTTMRVESQMIGQDCRKSDVLAFCDTYRQLVLL